MGSRSTSLASLRDICQPAEEVEEVGVIDAKSNLQKQLDRHGKKVYMLWPANLLRQFCTLRGIADISKEKDKAKLAQVLRALDQTHDRASPYIADLEDRAQGECCINSTLLFLLRL